MKIKEIVAALAALEGKKHQVSVGNVREIIGLLSDLAYASPLIGLSLYDNGKRRTKRKKK